MRWTRAVTAGAVVALVVVPGAPAVADPAVPTPVYGAVEHVAEVTLVTGDIVSVGVEPTGRLTAEVCRPAARHGDRPVLYSTVRDREALYVYPSDALEPIAAGRLDRRLFDVDYLVRNGFADTTTPRLPLIVRYGAGARAALPASAETVALPSVGGAALTVERRGRASSGPAWTRCAPARARCGWTAPCVPAST